MMRTKRNILALFGLAVIAVFAVSQLALSKSSRRNSTTGAPLVAAEAEESFAVFKHSGSAPPAPVAKLFSGSPYNVDTTEARLAQSSSSVEVWVIGGPELVCLAAREPSQADVSACAPIASAAGGSKPLVVSAAAPQGQLLLAGLVPDGVSDVELTTPGGAIPADVTNNTFQATVGAPPESISWTTADGARHSMAATSLSGQ